MKRLGLIGCSESKLATAAPARSIYTSQLFRMTLAYAETTCDRVVVLSAKHGLIELDQVIKPYDMTIRKFNRDQKSAWTKKVIAQLITYRRWQFVYLAGAVYINGLPDGEQPMKGLDVLQRYTWLSQQEK